MNYFNKYAQLYSYIFLSAYLFLISLTIFHYHHYNFQAGNYKLTQSSENHTHNPFDKFSDVDSECIVSHFSNTIDNISYVPIFSSKNADCDFFLLLKNNDKVPKQEFNYKHHLRAPPSKLS